LPFGPHALPVFSASDLQKLISQFRKSKESSAESIKRQENAAREVYRFCENTSECRRVQILHYFDEKFDKKQCAMGCDTCEDGRETVRKDVTNHARDTVKLLQHLVHECDDKVTLSHLGALLRGANTSDIRTKQHDKLPQYNSCSTMPKELLELMLDRLMLDDVITTVMVRNGSGYHNTYLDVICLPIPR
jgi:bloom syndrome protein